MKACKHSQYKGHRRTHGPRGCIPSSSPRFANISDRPLQHAMSILYAWEHFDENHEFLPKEDILRFEEIVRVVQALLPHGLRKVRLTGGEPLLRRI